MKKFALVFIATLATTSLLAQTDTKEAAPVGKKFNHYAGIQLNELVRQVFNFGGGAVTANTNPYLFTYNINHARTGLGLRIGAGYNYQSETNDDGITRRSTDINDLQARFGIEKMFSLSEKWSAGVGLDAVVSHNDDYTKSAVRGFDTVTTITSSKITSYGGGPMAWLRYHISDRVLIGTESSYYYTSGQQTDDIIITRRTFTGGAGGQLESTATNVDEGHKAGKLSVPVAFYLIVRF